METSTTGLSSEEAAKRLETYGTNEVARGKKRSGIVEFLLHFRSPVTLILIISAIVSGFSGDPRDAAIIIIIVLVSVILDFTQEYRAGKAAEALAKRVATTATVTRDGTKQDIAISGLVPGDVIQLTAGDIAPADARVIAAKDFFIDQSALTGESFPVEKTTDPITDKTDSTKWNNYLFMGTSVTAGSGDRRNCKNRRSYRIRRNCQEKRRKKTGNRIRDRVEKIRLSHHAGDIYPDYRGFLYQRRL